MKWLLLGLVAFAALLSACQEQSDEGKVSDEDVLRYHYEKVIVPETEAPLELIADSCQRRKPANACVVFALLDGELQAIRLARYREAAYWLAIGEPRTRSL